MSWRLSLIVDNDAADVVAVRQAHPDLPIPSLILISDATTADLRLQAILGLGRTYDIAGLVLGAWPYGATAALDDNARVAEISGRDVPGLAGAQMFQTPLVDIPHVIEAIRAAHGQPVELTETPEEPMKEEPGSVIEEFMIKTLHLRLLGPLRVEASGIEIKTGLRTDTRRLLALLALHPDGLPAPAICDALWTREPSQQALVQRLYDATNKGRIALREITGTNEVFIQHAGDRYQLDPHAISCDLLGVPPRPRRSEPGS